MSELSELSELRPDRPDIVIRRLAGDDWKQAREARLAALADAPYAFSSTLAKEMAYTDDLWRGRAGSGWTFGAFDGARIIGVATGIPAAELDPRRVSDAVAPGTAALGPRGDGCGDAGGTDWHLVGMWVAPDYRGQGVADRLVEAVCHRARGAGAATVTLWVTEINDRAAALYRRHGFAPTGVRELVRPEEPGNWERQLALRLR
jgi:ribosomal protein S18 acetylase RimI-like enzyme